MAIAFRKQSLLSSVHPVAVFFDLDNTLVETRKADNQTCRKVCKAHFLTRVLTPDPIDATFSYRREEESLSRDHACVNTSRFSHDRRTLPRRLSRILARIEFVVVVVSCHSPPPVPRTPCNTSRHPI